MHKQKYVIVVMIVLKTKFEKLSETNTYQCIILDFKHAVNRMMYWLITSDTIGDLEFEALKFETLTYSYNG